MLSRGFKYNKNKLGIKSASVSVPELNLKSTNESQNKKTDQNLLNCRNEYKFSLWQTINSIENDENNKEKVEDIKDAPKIPLKIKEEVKQDIDDIFKVKTF